MGRLYIQSLIAEYISFLKNNQGCGSFVSDGNQKSGGHVQSRASPDGKRGDASDKRVQDTISFS